MHLDVEVLFPNPVSATIPAEPTFQRRRGRVRRAELVIEQAALNRSLATLVSRRLMSGPFFGLPFDLIRVRIDGKQAAASLMVLFRCPPSPPLMPAGHKDGAGFAAAAPLREVDDGTERGPLWGTARISARRPPPGANDIVFGMSEVRLYGQSPLSAPLLGHKLLQILGAALLTSTPGELPGVSLASGISPLGLHLLTTPALSELRVELIHDALLDMLPRSGYRVAEPATAPLCEVDAHPGQLILRYAADGHRGNLSYADIDERPRSNPIIESSALQSGAPLPESLRIADHLLQGGDLCAALAAYQLISSSLPIAALARLRRLQVLAALPARRQEALQLAEAELALSPPSLSALLALAVLDEGREPSETTARRYLALGADGQSHPVERAAAFFTASRHLIRSDAEAARSARMAAESLLSADGPEEPLLEAIQAAALEAPRKKTAPPVPPPIPVPAAVQSLAPQVLPENSQQALRLELLEQAQQAAQSGEIERSRALLIKAGAHPEVLRARVQLDWPELLQAEAGSPGDLLPVLRDLQQLGLARPEELRGLARLLTARGEYAEALSVQTQAAADPDELLASLEAAGRSRDLLGALTIHAKLRPEVACLLYQQAASVAEHQLAERSQAAAYWQQAADAAVAESRRDDAALFFVHAGRLWNEDGDAARAYKALGRAVELGGSELPRLTLLLADLAYRLGDLDAASLYYRQALDAEKVPLAERALAYLRIAEAAQKRRDFQTEEQALARAVEVGGGAQAWPKLSALFRAQNDFQRLGTALLAEADHQSGAARIALLREAATLADSTLLPRIDEELCRLNADDEAVRDRQLVRHSERGEADALLQALLRDVARSQGERQCERAQELVTLALKLSAYPAAVKGFMALLDVVCKEPISEGSPATSILEQAMAFVGSLQRARAGSQVAPSELEALRQRLIDVGQLPQRLAQIEWQIDSLAHEADEEQRSRLIPLLARAAQMAELLGDEEVAVQRYLQLCASSQKDRETLERLRRILRGFSQSGHAEKALTLVETELRRLGPAFAQTVGLRLVLAELLMFLGRGTEALNQLEMVLLRAADLGPAHAMLGMLLGTSAEPGEVSRGLEHLLIAAYAPDVAAHEAGECALMAADMLAAAGIDEPVDLQTLRAEALPQAGYAERATLGTFVAVPTDFLEEALGEEASSVEKAADTPTWPGLINLPPLLGPVELLLHSAALLPGDPRPLEGLLGLTWSRNLYAQAADCCDRLLALPAVAADSAERSRIRLEKAHVELRLGREDAAVALLRQALVDAPESIPVLRALRRLLADSGLDEAAEALMLLQTEMKLCAETDRAQLAELWNDLGQLQERLGRTAAALEAFRRAGQLGLAAGWSQLADGLAAQGDWLGAADAAGRSAALTPLAEASGVGALPRGPLLLRAAELALRADDDLRARDYLAQAVMLGGDSAEAAADRLRELDGGPEPEKRRRTLERRLKHAGAGIERLEILRRLLLLCTELYERSAMVTYATALLRESPGDALGLCALAEDAIERGQPEVAASRLIQAGAIPPTYPRITRLLSCLGEVLERKGNAAATAAAYQRLLEAGERNGDIPAIDLALEGLARLREEQGDAAEAMRWLRRRLPHLPPDALAARTTLRLRMSDLAVTLGDFVEARQQLDSVLEESPGQRSALVKLLEVYRQLHEPAEALRVLDRLLDLTMTPGERAEWLFARAELCEKQLGDFAQAEALYEQVLSQWPAHARALRRLVALAARRGDGAKVYAAVAALSKTGAPLGDVQVLAGLGLLLPHSSGDLPPAEKRNAAQALLKTATAADLATALSLLGPKPGQDLQSLDGPLQGALQAQNDNATPLLLALRQRMQKPGCFDFGTAAVLARLCEHLGLSEQSLYWSALAFVTPGGGYADAMLDELGALPVPAVVLETALLAVRPIPPEQAPWLLVFGLLGRHILGVQPPALPSHSLASQNWEHRLAEMGRSVGLPRLEVVLVESLDGEVAVCEPTRPPRLRLLQSLTRDEAQTRFAALRALHLLRAGVPLGEHGGPDEMAALVRAAAALWLEGLPGIPRVEDISDLLPREREWLATLRALALHPEHAPSTLYEARAEAPAIQACLAILTEEPQRLAELWPALLYTAKLEASARALGQLGDLRAALYALCPNAAAMTSEERLAALQHGPLADLLAVATRLYG